MKTCISVLLALAGALSVNHAFSDDTPPSAAQAAWRRLAEGNARFVSGQTQHPGQDALRRSAVAQTQSPFAVVLTCADSRVAPEIYFDQGIGDLFVIRNAGNILNDHVIGSIEYAILQLNVPLIVVVGHERCGAISATLTDRPAPGHIGSIVEAIRPVVANAKDKDGDLLENAIKENARSVQRKLEQSEPILNERVKTGTLRVLSARYDLDTGKVEMIAPIP